MTLNVLDWFQKHNNEFQLTSWTPNSTDHSTAAKSSETTILEYIGYVLPFHEQVIKFISEIELIKKWAKNI